MSFISFFFCHSPDHSQITTIQLNRRVMGEEATVDTLCPGLLVPIISNSPMLAILAAFPSWAQNLAFRLCPTWDRGTEGLRSIGLHSPWCPPWATPMGSWRRFQDGKGFRSLASWARHGHSCLGSGLSQAASTHLPFQPWPLHHTVSSTVRRNYRCFSHWRGLSSKSGKLWRETDLHSESGSGPC